jgi:hypothetical protein
VVTEHTGANNGSLQRSIFGHAATQKQNWEPSSERCPYKEPRHGKPPAKKCCGLLPFNYLILLGIFRC